MPAAVTERLYYENACETSFEAAIVERRQIGEMTAVVLDRTAFYPTSGGQPHDTGTLNGIRVCEVTEDGGAVVHALDQPIKENTVSGEIDWNRRYDHMQQHTGQHILSESFIKTLDAHTVSFHMGADISTIDITRSPGTPDEWAAVEAQVREVIGRSLPIRSYWVEPEHIDALELRKVPDRKGRLRIIEIEGFDRTACGGTHCVSTGELGIIQLMNHQPKRVHGGLYRVEFLCGNRAVGDYTRRISLLNHLSLTLEVGEAELQESIVRLQEEKKRLEKRLEEAGDRLVAFEAKALTREFHEVGGINRCVKVFPDKDQDQLKKLAQELVTSQPCIALLGGGGAKPQLVFARSESLSIHMGDLMRGAVEQIGGRGGGRPDMAMGGGPDLPSIEKAIRWAEEQLTKPS